MSYTDYLVIFCMRFWAVALFLLLTLIFLLVFRSWSSLSARLNISSVTLGGILVCLIGVAATIGPAALRGTTDFVHVLRATVGIKPTVSGPYATATVTVALPQDSSGQHADQRLIVLQLWYPVDRPAVLSTVKSGPIACSQLDSIMHLPKSQSPYPFILFAPWLGGKADTSSLLTRSFASHGYVVAGLEDLAAVPPTANDSPNDEEVRLRPFDFTSEEQYKATLRRGTLRVERGAARATDATNRLAACVQMSPALRDRINFSRIGFVGHSIGGATAAETSFLDSRIAAVVNLDGAQFGHAGENPVPVPYFIFFSDIDPKIVNNLDPPHRYEHMLDQRDYRRTDKQLRRPDSYAFIIRGSYHDTFADPSLSGPSTLFRWLLLDPCRAHDIVQAHLLGFLDTYIKGNPEGLIGPNDRRYPEVRPFDFPH